MTPFDDALEAQKAMGTLAPASHWAALVLFGFNVHADVSGFIIEHATFEWEDVSIWRWRGWYDQLAEVRLPNPPQREGTLHEALHVRWHWWQHDHPDMVRALAWQVGIYGYLGRSYAVRFDVEPEVMDFFSLYYNGDRSWPGMFDMDGSGPKPRVVISKQFWDEPDLSNIVTWEIFTGLCSYMMGKFKDGPRRLPSSMHWIFREFFGGDPLATPYYQGGPP